VGWALDGERAVAGAAGLAAGRGGLDEAAGLSGGGADGVDFGQRPFVSGRELLVAAQDEVNLEADFCLVATVRGQLALTPPADYFVKRVDWHDDAAAQWRPHEGWIDAASIGGRRQVQRGWFNLFPLDGAPDHRLMRYRLQFTDAKGQPCTLVGVKDVWHGEPSLIWQDRRPCTSGCWKAT